MNETLACLSLGSNLGDRKGTIDRALHALNALSGCQIDQQSSYYTTAPWGKEDQPEFVNTACGLWCSISAETLIGHIHRIEKQLGRERMAHWGPRTLDIDIITFGQQQINSALLRVPHPLFSQRLFVLEPLAEIYPDLRIHDKRCSEHLQALRNSLERNSRN